MKTAQREEIFIFKVNPAPTTVELYRVLRGFQNILEVFQKSIRVTVVVDRKYRVFLLNIFKSE